MTNSWQVLGQEQCEAAMQVLPLNASGRYCNSTWDGFLCWPPTQASTSVSLPCPSEKGLDTSKFASRRCDREGRWEGRYPGTATQPRGWSNYSACFTKEIKLLMDKLYTNTDSDAQMKLQIAKETRVIEMAGLSISLVTLSLSLLIFIYFSSLRNKRTKIHKNLFFAMFAQVSIRLVLYTDQWLWRESIDNAISKRGHHYSIEKTPVLCEMFYVLIEYTRTAVFTWMLLEGSHLHTSIVIVFPRDVKFTYFHFIGWGLPLLLVAIWASVMATQYRNTLCWWGYPFSPYFWILEGPRMFIILVNLVILLNIVCVVLMKVQENTPSEFQQIRKAVRAALLLLPLLGITNILDIIPGPLEGTPLQFALWSYTTHVLSASQGFFISLLYCFLNKEVQEAVYKHWRFCKLTTMSICSCCAPLSPPDVFPVPRVRSGIEEKDETVRNAEYMLC